MQDLRSFFAPIHYAETIDKKSFEPLQWGAQISFATTHSFSFEEADIILLGCGESRGKEQHQKHYSDAPDAIREQLYQLYHWHAGIKIFDAGNLLQGASIEDSKAALHMVLQEFYQAGKVVIILGGSHDLTLEQYNVFKKSEQIINASVVDMLVDLKESETSSANSFLMEMLTSSPNFIGHYNHIAFQSYFVNPIMLETLDKIRFDFFRLGRVKDHIEEMEPVLRNSSMLSFDMNAIKYSDAPMNKKGSPNGLAGDEACLLTRYAGMSEKISSFGIYDFDERKDKDNMTAILITQMIWYFVDGFVIRKNEAALTDRNEFIEYHLQFTGNDILFLKSKRTNRWWMQLPDGNYEPCSYKDYLQASENEIPERWLRIQERG
jgi:arginase family enzyme